MAVPKGVGNFRPKGAGKLQVLEGAAWRQIWPKGLWMLAGQNSTLTNRNVTATSQDKLVTVTSKSQPTLSSNTAAARLCTYTDGAWWIVGAAVADVLTFAKSTDEGQTWTSVPVTITGIGANNPRFLVLRNGRWILGLGQATGGGVFISDDNMATWTRTTTAYPAAFSSQGNGLMDLGSYIAFVDTQGQSAYRMSTDNGSTWLTRTAVSSSLDTQRGTDVNPTTQAHLVIASATSFGWRVFRKIGSANTAGTMVASGNHPSAFNCELRYGDGVWLQGFTNGSYIRSTNDGSTWSAVMETGLTSLSRFAYGDGTWFAYSGSQAARSTDGGLTWTAVTLPANFSIQAAGFKA